MRVIDDRPDAAANGDGAVFAPTRVRSARSPRILASVAMIAVAGLVAIAFLDRKPPTDDVAAAPLSAAPAATAEAVAARSSRPPPRASSPRPAGHDPALDAVFELEVRPAGSHLFIHGDVFSLAVARVRVTIEDVAGHIAGSRSVAVPGGSRSFLLGAVPRFDVHFLVPDEVQADGYVIAATALDSQGRRLATRHERVARASASM